MRNSCWPSEQGQWWHANSSDGILLYFKGIFLQKGSQCYIDTCIFVFYPWWLKKTRFSLSHVYFYSYPQVSWLFLFAVSVTAINVFIEQYLEIALTFHFLQLCEVLFSVPSSTLGSGFSLCHVHSFMFCLPEFISAHHVLFIIRTCVQILSCGSLNHHQTPASCYHYLCNSLFLCGHVKGWHYIYVTMELFSKTSWQ